MALQILCISGLPIKNELDGISGCRCCRQDLYRDTRVCIAVLWQLEEPTSSWSPSRWPDTPSCQLTSGACAGSFQLEVPVECRLERCCLLLPGGLPFAMLPANGTLRR